MAPERTEREILEERVLLLERQAQLEGELPHLYGWPWYEWAWRYFNSTNRYNFLCAANQCSKSSTQIRKCIHWATATELWPKLWKRKPTQFWYLYPSLDVATAEFEEKWVKEFLPCGSMKDDPIYGWEAEYKQKKIHAIRFKSGVTVYFRSYEQKSENLQTSSVFAIFCDEELPSHLYSELNARISAATVRGYWHMVFTATLGQEMWRQCMEEQGTKHETFKNALKIQVSLYDCKVYMDGSPGPWTDEMIQETIDSCSTEAEVLRRVWGRFVVDEDRAYPSFSRKVNLAPNHKLPKGWLIYTGVDIGSGGVSGHPAAIVFVAVKPDFTQGRVFLGWRGDKIATTAGDILDKYMAMRGHMKPVGEFYDHQARDFYAIAQGRRPAVPFQKAEKGQDTGRVLLNTLFKRGMLKIYEDPELMKLVIELESLRNETSKSHARDDFIDALRFAVTRVPWDFSLAEKQKHEPPAKPLHTERERAWLERKEIRDTSGLDLLEAEIDLANEDLESWNGGELW